MNPSLTLWILCDGKRGHENQSLGLAEAVARLTPTTIHRIDVDPQRNPWTRLRQARLAAEQLSRPDLIIAAGHATHLPLFTLSRKFKAKSIVLMHPSLPMGWFDLCLIPAHDFANPPARENLVITRGVLNRIPPPTNRKREGGMILIGGPSASHGWNGDALIDAVGRITQFGKWQITDSRRTPVDFLEQLQTRFPNVNIVNHAQTSADWLPDRLCSSSQIWVTEDSVSMIHEALSSGANVGILPMPAIKKKSRVVRGLEWLIAGKYLTTYSNSLPEMGLVTRAPRILRESDRCAFHLLGKFGHLNPNNSHRF